jgi:trans-aconitate 2-methyltransferase
MVSWSPTAYLHFADERARPFVELTGRIAARAPHRVVDLGCGPGQLTATLAQRWPDAHVLGLDSSTEMVERARQLAGRHLEFEVGDISKWSPDQPVDVIVSNATLQWVPDHRALLPYLVRRLAPAGWLAFQVPGNFDQPSHALLDQLAQDPRFADDTRGLERPSAFGPDVYLGDLSALGLRVDAWETTYLHVLNGDDPVFSWISGTGARPVLQALSGEQRELFVAEYKALLRAAYPPQKLDTVLPFRRVFVVAQRVDGTR